jgi:hypothetical protein
VDLGYSLFRRLDDVKIVGPYTFLRPAELRAVAPDAVHDHRQASGQGDYGLLLTKRLLAMLIAQAFSHDHLVVRVSMT